MRNMTKSEYVSAVAKEAGVTRAFTKPAHKAPKVTIGKALKDAVTG